MRPYAFVLSLALAIAPTAAAEPPHWDYGAEHGPAVWARLDPAFSACASSRSQSPIDLPSKAGPASNAKARADAPGISVGRAAHVADVLNNGHTLQVNYAGADTLTIAGTGYVLVQYHFHGPSEHTVDGKHFPMEMHLVHKSADGKLAVIGVLIEEGAAHAAFDPVWAKLPKDKGADRKLGAVDVDVDELLPTQRTAFAYDGSLTTPPCSEGVKWLVMKTPIALSAAQIKSFRDIIHGNNRPPQPANGRVVVTEEVAYR